MSVASDNLIALTVLKRIVVPFNRTDAFKLKLIDKDGNVIKSPQTIKEKNALTKLDLLAFNLKKILSKLPGGSSIAGSLVGALYLIKENVEPDYDVLNYRFEAVMKLINSGVKFINEEIMLAELAKDNPEIDELINEEAPVTSGGTGVALGGLGGAGTGSIAGADGLFFKDKKKKKIVKRKPKK